MPTKLGPRLPRGESWDGFIHAMMTTEVKILLVMMKLVVIQPEVNLLKSVSLMGQKQLCLH